MSEPRFDRDSHIHPHPERRFYQGDLGDSAYEYHAAAGMHGYGLQAFIDLPARDDATKGLRVTTTRGSLEGLASDGVQVSITRINASVLSVVYSAANKTLTGNVQDASTLSQVKTAIDAITGDPLTTSYYGGETGTSMAEATLGDQATFDVLSPGFGDRGLRVAIDRTSLEGDGSNGVEVSIVPGTTTAVAFSATAKTVTLTVAPGTFIAALKTAVDAITGLTSVYFGGENGERQATFRLLNRNHPTRGLLVTIARTSLEGEASNDVEVDITRVNGDALSMSFDATAKTVEGNVRNATTMSALKTEVDGVTGLSSVYFGGETGTGNQSRATATETVSAGGMTDPLARVRAPVQLTKGGTADPLTAEATADFPCWLDFLVAGNFFVQVVPGTTAPTNDTGAILARSTGVGRWVYVPAGHRAYVKRQGTTDIAGTVSRYRIQDRPALR